MSGSSETPWSNNAYAPQIPYSLYSAENANFAGVLIGAILDANLNIQSISYIDNREFPGTDQQPPGPPGYQYLIYSAPLSIVGNLMFVLNNCADLDVATYLPSFSVSSLLSTPDPERPSRPVRPPRNGESVWSSADLFPQYQAQEPDIEEPQIIWEASESSIGAWTPFHDFNDSVLSTTVWRLVIIGILVLLLRCLPIIVALYKWIPDVKTFREAIFSGHFGPMGVSAIFISTLAVQKLPHTAEGTDPQSQPELLAESIQPIISFVAPCSILVHGLSIPSFSPGKHVHTVSRTWS